MILALDTATVTGWAHGPAGANPPLLQWGARDFSGRGGNGEVIAKFRHWLNARCFELKPRLIVFESPYIPHPGKRTGPPMNALVLRRLLAMVGIVEAIAFELRIECCESRPSEITKFFTGSARHGGRDAKKAATVEMCRAYGWDVGGDDNAADALALWAMAEAKLNPRASSLRGDGRLFLPQKKEAPAATPAPLNHNDEGSSNHGRQPSLI
jgi:hypothetical protein